MNPKQQQVHKKQDYQKQSLSEASSQQASSLETRSWSGINIKFLVSCKPQNTDKSLQKNVTSILLWILGTIILKWEKNVLNGKSRQWNTFKG